MALVIQVANPGTLALSEAEFERRNEPTAFIKCDYKNMPQKFIYNATQDIVNIFDVYKEKDNIQYFAMHQATAAEITKEEFEQIEYDFHF